MKPVKDTDIKQDTAPPLMMYARDMAKLDALDLPAFGVFWAVQMWAMAGGNGYEMSVPKSKLAVATQRRATPKVLAAAVPQLLAEGIWSDAGDVYVIELHHQIAIDVWRDPVARWKALRNKRLHRDTDLLQRIRDRDRLLCRYCGVRTRWDGDKKSKISGSYDHVDPDGDNHFDNVVVACRHCNLVEKKDRTLDQTGMSLYVPGTTAADIAAGRARKFGAASGGQASAPEQRTRSDLGPPGGGDDGDPDPIQIRSGSRNGSARAPARLRTEPDPDQIGSRSETPAAGGVSVASAVPDVPPLWSDEEVDGYPQYPADDEGVS